MTTLEVAIHNVTPMRLDAEFACAAGELVALVGPSGSGKTSLLRAIAGLLKGRTLRGRIGVGPEAWFDSERGVDLAPAATARRSGVSALRAVPAPDGPAERCHCGAPASLTAAAVRRRCSSAWAWPAWSSVVRPSCQAGSSSGWRWPGHWPVEPRVLLLDEPFSAVDAPARQALYHELASLRQSLSTPMVLVTHDLGEARRLADRVVILDAGQTLQTGSPAQVFASPRNARVAELVGIQNHFSGRFHKQEPGWGRLGWGEREQIVLRVLDKNRIADGSSVTWVIAGERVDVLPDGMPQGNTLRCQIVEQLALGETSLCTLQPEGLPGQPLTLNLSTAQLRSLDAGVGRCLRLQIPPEAVHIMPLKDGAAADPPQAR